MLSGATLSASEMAGTAVFRIVVSSDSMKNATATSHGRSRLLAAAGGVVTAGTPEALTGSIALVTPAGRRGGGDQQSAGRSGGYPDESPWVR